MAAQGAVALGQSHPLTPAHKISEFSQDSFCCAKLDSDDSPVSSLFRHPGDGSWIFVLGTASYAGKRISDSMLPDLLSEVRQNPGGASKKLDGVFTVVAFDADRKRAIVVPSALGELAIYVRKNEQGIIGISTSIHTLATLGPVSLDEFTCRTLYRCGHRLPPSTVFNEIKSIRLGCLLEVEGGRCEEQNYWSPSFAEPVGKTLASTANEIAELLTGYCTSLIEPGMSVVSDLTGGFDSRVTTACLMRAGIPFVPTVSGSNEHPDVIISRRICQGEELPLMVVDTEENLGDVSQDIKAAVTLSEGCVDTAAYMNTLRVKRKIFSSFSQRPVVAVGGGLGECYRDFYWYQEFLDRGKRKPASIEKLIRYRIDARPLRMDFFAQDWHRDWREQIRSYVEGVIQPYSGERNTAQIDVVYLHKMTGMVGGTISAMARWSAPLAPFFSTAALDRALSVPPQWRYGSRLLRQICSSVRPRVAEYTALQGGPCAPMTLKNWYRFLPKYQKEVERVIRKASTVFLGKTLFPEYLEPPPTSNPYADFMRQEVRPGGHLDFESMETASWYAPEMLAALLQEARAPLGYNHRRAVLWIYTCEAMSRWAHTNASQQIGTAHS
jgi:hypothetical protein